MKGMNNFDVLRSHQQNLVGGGGYIGLFLQSSQQRSWSKSESYITSFFKATANKVHEICEFNHVTIITTSTNLYLNQYVKKIGLPLYVSIRSYYFFCLLLTSKQQGSNSITWIGHVREQLLKPNASLKVKQSHKKTLPMRERERKREREREREGGKEGERRGGSSF